MGQAMMYARLVKVDEATRQVTGVIASETPDLAKEIMDYDKSKPNFEAWSETLQKATDGKSLGNVREMHKPIAAGLVKSMEFNDDAKEISVTAEIVDDAAWAKVEKGVYTGFSIGGKYDGAKWDDPVQKGYKRYAAKPSEVSLVDLPCNPGASFTMVKADGAEELVKFQELSQDELLAKIADAETAPEDRLDYIQRLAKANGLNVVAAEDEDLQKSAWSIGELARAAENVRFLRDCYGTDIDGNPRAFGDDVKKAAGLLYDALLKMVSEDVDAAKASLKKALDDLALADEQALTKRAVLDDTFGDTLLTVHVNEELGKFVSDGDAIERLVKFIADNGELKKQLDETTAELAKVKAEPAPAKGAVKQPPVVVNKADDSLGKSADKGDEPKDTLSLMKAAQSRPIGINVLGSAIPKPD